MIGSSRTNEKEDKYCEHTCPRSFHALHYEDSTETKEDVEVEILGRKVTNEFALYLLSLIVNTIWLVLSVLKPLFHGNLIRTEKKKIINDYRCGLCKEESKTN